MAPRSVHQQNSEEALGSLMELDRNRLPNDPRIDEIVSAHMQELGSHLPRKDRDRVPGVAVAVRKDLSTVHINCYGFANLETGTKITVDTIFDLGSLSKQFTAVAILDLVNRQQLALTDPLSKFFNGFPRYADEVTIEDLVHHTSALPEYWELFVASRRAEKDWYDVAMSRSDEWYPHMTSRQKEITNRDVMKWIATQTLLPRAPDTEFKYSNSGYVVLAEVVRKVARKRFASVLKDKLFTKFGLADTYVFDELSKFPDNAPEVVNHARCYNRVSGDGFVPVGYTPLNFITGDGNVHSTILDMAIWEQLLNVLDDVANPTAAGGIRAALWQPAQLKNHKRVNYGWGWHLLTDKYEGKATGNGLPTKYESRAEYHRGRWLAWRNHIARASRWVMPKPGKKIDPDTVESLGIIVLSNNNQLNTCRIAQDISRVFWGPLKKDNIINSFNC